MGWTKALLIFLLIRWGNPSSHLPVYLLSPGFSALEEAQLWSSLGLSRHTIPVNSYNIL